MGPELAALLDVILRWVHIGAGLIWIGHNYVNVVLSPRFVPLGPEVFAADAASPELEARSRREHAVFRHTATITWVAGAVLLWRSGMAWDAVTLHGYAAVIGMGAWIGTIMVLNLWLVMWPHQKKSLGFVPAGVEERARCARVTFLSSRTNTILSIPLLFLMGASTHGLSLF
ncbi:MAG: urate hydroxylase PuuD [Alphaproteobacteria bacterium]